MLNKSSFLISHENSEPLHEAIQHRLVELGAQPYPKKFVKTWPWTVILDGVFMDRGAVEWADKIMEDRGDLEIYTLGDLYTRAKEVYMLQLEGSTFELTKDQVIEVRDGLNDLLDD